MWKNSGSICENYEEVAKKMKAKFLVDRICKYKECPKMVKEAVQHLKRSDIVW